MEEFVTLEKTQNTKTYYMNEDMLNEIVVLTEPTDLDLIPFKKGMKRTIYLHSHMFYEMIYVLSGSGTHIINNEERPMKKGDVFLLAPNVLHRYYPEEDCDDLKIYNVIFSQIPSKTFKLVGDYASANLSSEAIIRFESHLHNMEAEFTTRPIGYRDNMHAYCQLLLSEMMRAEVGKSINSNQRSKLDLVISFIEENYATTSFQECAQISSYCPTYFCRLFKEATGLTFGEYINNKKIAAAAKLLLETDDSIESIANQVNLQNGNHFYSLFKKHMGLTPKAFRKMRQIP